MSNANGIHTPAKGVPVGSDFVRPVFDETGNRVNSISY